MRIKQRIYEDYLKPSRLPDYKKVLEAFHDAGYQMVGILDLHKMVTGGGITGRLFINRHDIDTSPRIAKEMFEIEKEVYGHEGSASYYFRKSTIDRKLIAAIDSYGYETGYHYEEIADYEKQNRYKDIEKIWRCIPEIREIFEKNLEEFRRTTGSPSHTVASHGDFINVKFDYGNQHLLEDAAFRIKNNIYAEAYDQDMMRFVQARFADQILLDQFSNKVMNAINCRIEIIMLLTHPRNWKVDVIWNSKDNISRFVQGLKYNKM